MYASPNLTIEIQLFVADECNNLYWGTEQRLRNGQSTTTAATKIERTVLRWNGNIHIGQACTLWKWPIQLQRGGEGLTVILYWIERGEYMLPLSILPLLLFIDQSLVFSQLSYPLDVPSLPLPLVLLQLTVPLLKHRIAALLTKTTTKVIKFMNNRLKENCCWASVMSVPGWCDYYY